MNSIRQEIRLHIGLAKIMFSPVLASVHSLVPYMTVKATSAKEFSQKIHFCIILEELQLTIIQVHLENTSTYRKFRNVCIHVLCVTGVVRILLENIPKHARHPGKFNSSLLLSAQAFSCNMSIKQPFLYFRKFVDASAMASLDCGWCGCLSHSISCVYVQICERWKVKEHDTSTGKAIVLCLCVLPYCHTRKCCLTGKSISIAHH